MTEPRNVGGRPPLFKTPEELSAKADEYFDDCTERNVPYTVAGCAYFLGFEDRHSLAEQAKREGFSATTKRVLLRIETRKTEMMVSGEGSTAGLIFDMKNNHGLRDKHEMEVSGEVSLFKMKKMKAND